MARILQSLLVVLSLLIGVSFATAAGRRQVREVSPAEFRQEVSDRIVTVMLKDGRHFKAQVIEVGDHSARLKVTKSKLGGAFAAGSEQEVSYSEIGAVSYFKQQGNGRWILPLAAGGVGFGFLGFVAGLCNNEGGRNCDTLVGSTAGAAAGATALAAYGGYRLDRVEVQLHVKETKE